MTRSRLTRTLPGELVLIETIRRQAVAPRSRFLAAGIGDDCAVLHPKPGHEICVTTDFSLEGRHFRRDWHPPQSVGHRCLARGLSDLAAMGAEPVAVFLSLALPARLPAAWFDGFLAGFLALARRHNVPLAGGDTAQSPGGPNARISGARTPGAKILADIVAVGQLPRGQALLRSGASPGDQICITGALGGAAAELHALSTSPAFRRSAASRARRSAASGPSTVLKGHGFSRAGKAAEKAGALAPEGWAGHPHLYPQPRLAAGRRLRALATACIDLSDGLSTDLAHLCRASGVSALLRESALPLHPLARAAADPLALALHGGEDYELLFTVPPGAKIPRTLGGIAIHPIGILQKQVRNRPLVSLEAANGRRSALEPGGWEHFSV